MRLNLKSARKLKKELGEKTELSASQIARLEAVHAPLGAFVPKEFSSKRSKVWMIRFKESLEVYFIPSIDKPQYPPYNMWIVEK